VSSRDPFDRPDSGFNNLEGWTWIGCYGGYYLQADRLVDRGFEHGFFTRRWQGRGPDELAGYISAGISVHRPQQIHSGIVLDACEAVAEPWPQADGLVSDRGGQSLWVCGADCTPVLIADPGTGHTAACHAGWRGVAARILPEAIARLEQRGAQRTDLVVALGPAVSGARYQVGQDVVDAISDGLAAEPGDREARQRQLRSAGALMADPQEGKHLLDIRGSAVEQLLKEGLDQEQIARCPLCTIGEPDLFHSWRRDQVKAVQWSGIVSQAVD
jgi:YfiH family protein